MAPKRKTKPKQKGRPEGSGGKAPSLSVQELRTLFRVARAGRNGARNEALLAVLACGCRVSEPLSLTLGDVLDPRGRVADSFVLKASSTKNGKHRRVFLNQQARQALQAWVDELEPKKSQDLFPLNTNYATQMVAALMKEAGIKDGSSHSLRRTCATMMSEAGVAVKVIQETLGHSSLATTQIYLDHSPANVSKAVNTAVKW